MGRLDGHRQSVLALADAGEGRLVSVSRDRTLRLWDVRESVGHVIGTTGSTLLAITTLPDDRVATGDAEGDLTIWNLQDGTASRRRAHSGWVWAIKTTHDGGLVTASEDGTVRLWDGSNDPVATLDCGEPLRTVDCWTDDTRRTWIAAGSASGRIHLAERVAGSWQRRVVQAHTAAVTRLRHCSKDGLLSCGEDGRVYHWALPMWQQRLIREHDNFATDAIRLRDGAILSSGYDGRIRRD